MCTQQDKVSYEKQFSEDHKQHNHQKDTVILLLNCNVCMHTLILGALCTHVTNSWVLKLSCRLYVYSFCIAI